ncbi:TPA: hypothetical protein HA295_02495 [Candidatus Woesearchaeota archaeon]|nr:hypothetical protein [Candidatus Woesearchaeota archaeon]HII65623.1 hypothetical protein [Candidatus Woesearchaeota archaeon]
MAKFNAAIGATASAWLLALLVIAGELSGPLKALLKDTFGHHWIGKAVLVTGALLLFGFVFRDRKSIGTWKDEKAAWVSVLLSLAAIFLFFIIHYLIK